MSLYTRARKHIDMNRVKELREEKIKRKEIAEIVEQQQKIRAELEKIKAEESKHINWRREISEGMTSSDLFLNSLPATGDNVNDQIVVSDISEFDPTTSGAYDNTVGVNEYVPYDYNIASGVFDGAITSQNGFTFNPPFTSPGNAGTSHRRTYGSYDQTTNKFLVTNDTISLQAIAGNSTNFRYGLGTNGGTKPLYDLDIYYLEFDDDGNLASSGDIGSIPKSTHTLTQFNFNIPPKLFGKQIQLYISSDDGSNAIHWWLGNSVSFHPTAISADTNNWFHGILNQDILPAATGFPGMDKTSMAYIIWTNMQKEYAGNSWDTTGSGVAGYPAPVSGGTRKLGEQDDEGNTIPQAMTQADLDYIVNYIETTFAAYHGMTTTMWGITNLQFKRQLPMSVFVGLDDPDAASFVRDGNWDRLTPSEKKRLLEEQLAASSEYLDKMFGEGMPGTATEIADIQPQQSFSDIALGTEYGSQSTYGTKPDGTQGFPEPGELNKGNDGKWYEYAPGGWVPVPSVDAGGGDTMVAANQGPSTPVKYDKDMNQLVPNPGGGRPGKIRLKGKANMYAHHEPQGKVLTEKKRLKSPKDLVNKIPGYYDGKPSPLGFPIEEPPKMKNGYHPDLVDGKKVSQRFNRLDPHSAEFMPPTGNPEIDAKIKKATNTKEKQRKTNILYKSIRENNYWNRVQKWRYCGVLLDEGMTSSGVFQTTLSATGDVTLSTLPDTSLTDADLDGSYVDYPPDVDFGVAPRTKSLPIIDTSTFDTMVITVSGAGNTRTIDGSSVSDSIRIGVLVGGTYVGNYISGSLTNGTYTISIPERFRNSNTRFDVVQSTAIQGVSGTVSVSSIRFQRRTPITVFVSLDSPEAASFIRDGNSDALTPEERKRLLEQQLAASDEYMLNQFGEGMPKSATISDTEPQQSFSDIAQGLPYTDEDDAFDDPYYQGPPPDLDDDSDFNPDDFEYARIYPPDADPGDIQWPRKKNEKVPPGPGARPSGKPIGPELPKAKKKPTTMVAHHEPEGEVISEKKRLKSPKDLVDKIPGYYDGKPSPLGFPIEEPPKMKNGFHPDLVDGKKVSDRFNRLDPESAKAMPKTGNPHIDKKVRAAAKKPK